jgi:hypothetical protein
VSKVFVAAANSVCLVWLTSGPLCCSSRSIMRLTPRAQSVWLLLCWQCAYWGAEPRIG